MNRREVDRLWFRQQWEEYYRPKGYPIDSPISPVHAPDWFASWQEQYEEALRANSI